MALTASNPIPLGSKAPDFRLRNTLNDQMLSLQDIRGTKGTLVMFICNHCPYVKHINRELVRLCNDYHVTGFGVVAISSNDAEAYPQDGPKEMRLSAIENRYPFPYLYDPTQEVAKAYDAACTPDFYLFDAELKLVYHGQLDSSRPGNKIPVNGTDLRQAIDRILSNNSPLKNQIPSMGCNIKWKE